MPLLLLLTPPALVAVEDDGVVRPAWLLARRGERCFVCVSRGAGDNALRWVDATRLRPAGAPAEVAAARPGLTPLGGLPRAQR